MSHRYYDLVKLFEPISKYSVSIITPEIIPEVIRKTFKQAEAEKPGVSFIEFPENVGRMETDKAPLKVQSARAPAPPQSKIDQAAQIISSARYPIVMAGNGVIRHNACPELVVFAEKLNVPVATTFMAKGAIPFSHSHSLGTVGLQAHDYVACGFDRADVIICVGYDMIEYHPYLWHKDKDRKIVHLDTMPAEVDEHYILEVGVVGCIKHSLAALAECVAPRADFQAQSLIKSIVDEIAADAAADAFPMKPQRIISDLRQVLEPEDVVISDVGAHKMWMARMYQAEVPNTCIISNGFASMGIGVPGAIAAKLVAPNQTALAVMGDAGFMMNSQEIETALRIGTSIIILIWNDGRYGLIKWHQLRRFGRDSHIDFTNPDFVKYAESFGAKGYRVKSAGELVPTLRQAIADDTVVVIDCPVDYSENMKLTEKLGNLVCPV